jgi:hypothetical protein
MEDQLTNSALEELASWHVRLARRTGDRQLFLTASRRVLALRGRMTADEYRRDPRVAPRPRALASRLLLTEEEWRAEEAAEEADLRELAEADRSEVKAVRP